MKKEEIVAAREMVQGKIKALTEWVIKNHNNPYVNKVSADIRSCENDRDYLNDLESKLYPSPPTPSTPLGDQTETK
jgi:hypothetical protein